MNKNLDMLNGRLCSKILIYAVPLALTGILQQLFNASDVAVVGRFAGEAAMAAVGCNTPVVSFLVNLFLG
ncbi:MAG: MATE family efflux transporter, partial [Treponema sp.]|nr:MATE family efflux transporter [Treponema sp.]